MNELIGNISRYLAVAIWAGLMAFVVKCAHVSPLFLIGLMGVGSALIQGSEVWIKRERDFRASARACLFEALGMTGYRILAFPPLMIINPIEAAILIHLWLSAAIVFGLMMAGRKLGARHIIGGLCFLIGAGLIVYDGFQVWHLLALAGALVSGWHIAKSAYFEDAGIKASVIGNLSAGSILLLLSFIAGESWRLSMADAGWLAGVVVVSNVAWLLWIKGASKANERQSKVIVLFKPVATVAWIWLLCGVTPSAVHFMSLAAITMAGLILSPHVFRSVKTECV